MIIMKRFYGRAIRILDKERVEGYPISVTTSDGMTTTSIVMSYIPKTDSGNSISFPIDVNTLEMSTGELDRDSKLIFENDWLQIEENNTKDLYHITWSEFKKGFIARKKNTVYKTDFGSLLMSLSPWKCKVFTEHVIEAI